MTDIAGTDGTVSEDLSWASSATNDGKNESDRDPRNERATRKYEKMVRRTKLAFLMLFLFCIIVSLGHIWVVITVWVIQACAFRELTNLRYKDAKEKMLPWFRTFHWSLFISATLFSKGRALLLFCKNTPYVFSYGWDERVRFYGWALDNWDFITFNLYAALFVVFVLSLKRGYYKYQFSQLTWTVFSLVITMVQANGISENILEGYFWFIMPVMLIACNDTMAYFTGAFFGRKFIKRKFLRLSPKKTWEGFIGGMICTLIFSFFFSRILARSQFFYCPYDNHDCDAPDVMMDRTYELPESVHALARATLGVTVAESWVPSTITMMPVQIHGLWLGAFASLIAPFGGFFASGIKRAYKVKDFNNIIPGHGGIMDRVDCQFIMACYTRVHYMTWIQPRSVMGVASILTAIRLLDSNAREELLRAIRAEYDDDAAAFMGVE